MIASRKSFKHVKPRASEFARKAERALVRAQREAARENARYGLPLIVVENGKIVALPT